MPASSSSPSPSPSHPATTDTSGDSSTGLPPLHQDLQDLLHRMRRDRRFLPSDWIAKKTAMFNSYMARSGLRACVVSVSGGIDSACVLALLKHAQAQPGSAIERVVGIAQPIHSTESVWRRALLVGSALHAEMITVDQSSLHTQLKQLCDSALQVQGGSFASGQLKSYMRTPVGFYAAQLLSQSGYPCVVVGTGNYDEDGYLMYFCKAGDGVCDVQLLADLHKEEVFAVSRELGVPEEVLQAPPSADLWEGQTDEEELGFSYDFVELLTEWFKRGEQEQDQILQGLSQEARTQWDKLKGMAEQVHRRNKHKEHYPLNLNVL